MSQNRELNSTILLAIIVTLGAVLRLVGLTTHSLWVDELWSWKASSFGTISEVFAYVTPDVHPPGYQILLFYVERFFGDDAFHLRLPSALAGILAVYLIYRLGVLVYSSKEGLMASAWMAVSWAPVYFSQEARAYSFLLLFSIMTVYFWLLLLERSVFGNQSLRSRESVGYLFATVVTIYLHYFGLILVLLQASSVILFLIWKKKNPWSWAGLYLLVLASYTPWLPSFWIQLNREPNYIMPVKYSFFMDFLRFCFNESLVLMLLVMALVALYWVRSRKAILQFAWADPWKGIERNTLILWGWLVLPFALGFLKSFFSNPILTEKNLIVSLPAVYLLLARVVSQFSTRKSLTTALGTGICLLLGGHLVFAKDFYSPEPQKQQYREAITYVIENQNHDRASTLILGSSMDEDFFNYYFEKLNSPLRIDLLVGENQDIPKVRKTLEDHHPGSVWFVFGHRKPEPDFTRMLNQSLVLVDRREFKRITVEHYRSGRR